jgi:hypothetical protein
MAQLLLCTHQAHVSRPTERAGSAARSTPAGSTLQRGTTEAVGRLQSDWNRSESGVFGLPEHNVPPDEERWVPAWKIWLYVLLPSVVIWALVIWAIWAAAT